MKRTIVLAFAAAAFASPGIAASITNSDAEPRTVVVTEGKERREIALGAGETVQLCDAGCFVTMPNGDRQALEGGESVEITGGRGKLK